MDIPKVGKLPKKVLIPVGVAAAVYIGWRWYQARQDSTDTTAVDAGNPEFDNGSIPPTDSMAGTLTPSGSGGSGDTGSTDDGVLGPGEFTNNGQWSDYVIGKLEQSDTWTYTDIVTAIGLGLDHKPTSTVQQNILRAAMAVGGQPPQGSILIISGGNAPPPVVTNNKPAKVTGLHASKVTTSEIYLDWADANTQMNKRKDYN